MAWLFLSNPDKRRKEFFKWAQRNKIDGIRDETSLLAIKKLIASGKKISRLTPFINSLENIEILDLSYNLLEDLPKEIAQLQNLKKIYLGFNNFKEIPEVIFKLNNLEVLSLEANQIKTIPRNIKNLISLKELNLFANQLEMLPQEIGELLFLNRLNLALNRLLTLPDSFKNLKNITNLEIWLNKFTNPPEQLKSLINLKNFQTAIDSEQLNKTLIWAVIGDNLYLADKLIASGADVNYKDYSVENQLFTTPLFEAKSLSMITLLLTMGADPYLEREIIKHIKTNDGIKIKHTGKYESFLTKAHPKEIEKFKKSYLNTLTLINKK